MPPIPALCSFNPLPDDNLDSSKLKYFADDNLKFEENGRQLFKPVENTVVKGEIARYECLQKACFPGASKGVIVWEWVKHKTFVPYFVEGFANIRRYSLRFLMFSKALFRIVHKDSILCYKGFRDRNLSSFL